MSDKPSRPAGFQGPGQGPDVSPAAAGSGGSQETEAGTQVVTRQEVERLIQEAEDRATRRAQSLTDKAQTRFAREIQRLEAAGVKITPEVEKRVEEKIINDQLSGSSGSGSGAAQPGDGDGAAMNPISQAAFVMMQEADVYIYEDDPEFETLDQSSPAKFLASMQAAIDAKQSRSATSEQPTSEQPRRVPTNLGAGGVGTDLEAQYKREVNQPGLTREQRLQIRRKFRREHPEVAQKLGF